MFPPPRYTGQESVMMCLDPVAVALATKLNGRPYAQ